MTSPPSQPQLLVTGGPKDGNRVHLTLVHPLFTQRLSTPLLHPHRRPQDQHAGNEPKSQHLSKHRGTFAPHPATALDRKAPHRLTWNLRYLRFLQGVTTFCLQRSLWSLLDASEHIQRQTSKSPNRFLLRILSTQVQGPTKVAKTTVTTAITNIIAVTATLHPQKSYNNLSKKGGLHRQHHTQIQGLSISHRIPHTSSSGICTTKKSVSIIAGRIIIHTTNASEVLHLCHSSPQYPRPLPMSNWIVQNELVI